LFTIRELTTPYRAAANLCGMDWLPPFAVLGINRGVPKSQRVRHAEDYRRILIALRDDRLDLDRARSSELLNQSLDAIMINEA
jgi:glutathione-regulated potassium-efflux system ancillary protein KefG